MVITTSARRGSALADSPHELLEIDPRAILPDPERNPNARTDDVGESA